MVLAMLPATFCATTVRMFVPGWRTIPLAVQFVVPMAIPLAVKVAFVPTVAALNVAGYITKTADEGCHTSNC